MTYKIHVCEPSTTALEKEWVNKALDNNWISPVSPIIPMFEEAFAKYVGVKHCIAVDSGWSALLLPLKALGVGPGDEVIVPTFTMIATANAVAALGATPVLVDCEENGNIDVTKIEEKITPRTKGIIPVHIYGHPCDMDEINDLADWYGLFVLEDAAEAHGAEYKGKKAGSLGDVAAFSLYANKTMTTGQGGLITTDRDDLAKHMRSLRAYDFHPKRHFCHREIAGNHRMGGLHAAYGMAQIERLDEMVAKRRANADQYTERLKGLVQTPTEADYVKNTHWMYGIVTDHRDTLMDWLEVRGIETRTYFYPMHWQKPYKTNEAFPVADFLGERGMYLPSSTDLTDKDLRTVCDTIEEFFANVV